MVSTHYGDADLTPPQGFPRPEGPDGFTVAPAVIGGDLPEAAPAPPPPAPPREQRPEPEETPKRSFFGKLLRRNG